jgi:hypothetical protein
MRHLPHSMDACVRAAGPNDWNRDAKDPLQGLLKGPLHGHAVFTDPLPAPKRASVVLNRQLEASHIAPP